MGFASDRYFGRRWNVANALGACPMSFAPSYRFSRRAVRLARDKTLDELETLRTQAKDEMSWKKAAAFGAARRAFNTFTDAIACKHRG